MPGAVVELVGARKVMNDLRAMSSRMDGALVRGMNTEFAVLEQAETNLFDSYGGMYVKTGKLKASLTQRSAEGAIRQWHGNAIEFGTSIWYARFQRTIGGPSGKPRGRVRIGPSKILKLSLEARQAARQAIADQIMGRV